MARLELVEWCRRSPYTLATGHRYRQGIALLSEDERVVAEGEDVYRLPFAIEASRRAALTPPG